MNFLKLRSIQKDFSFNKKLIAKIIFNYVVNFFNREKIQFIII